MANQTWVNVGGVWEKAKTWVNVGGVWKDVVPKGMVGDSWKEFGSSFPIVIDDFESGNLNNYHVPTSAPASIDTAVKRSGGHSLRIPTYNYDTIGTIHSMKGLDHYPKRGDKFGAYFRYASGGIAFGSLEEGRYYRVTMTSSVSSYFRIHKCSGYRGDQELELASVTASKIFGDEDRFNPKSGEEWLRITVSWGTDGSIVARLYDKFGKLGYEISAVDGSYSSGGIGFLQTNAKGNSTTWVDDIEIIGRA